MKNGRIKVALLSGGKSGEREVSLKSGAQVARALDPERYEVFHYDPAVDLSRILRDAHALDVALIAMHGRFGEDGTIQGLLDLAGLPYQGSGPMASALCMDKRAAKKIYRLHGLTAPRDVVLEKDKLILPGRIMDILGLPVVVKPACEGSSLGVTIARTPVELEEGIDEALSCGRWAIAEEYIKGREITASVLGNDILEALPLVEIQPEEGYVFFNYEAKYKPGASREICPAPLSDVQARKAREIGLKAHRALFCTGLSRTDMILKDDAFYVLETNTIPGMTETSLFPQAAAAGGYPFPKLMDRLIELALEN